MKTIHRIHYKTSKSQVLSRFSLSSMTFMYKCPNNKRKLNLYVINYLYNNQGLENQQTLTKINDTNIFRHHSS